MDKRRFAPVIPFLLFASLLLTACGTFEVRIERTATPGSDAPTGALTTDPRPTMQITPTPAPSVTPAAVATVQPGIATAPSYRANGHSGSPAISADGRYVVFSSSGDNLVPGDTNSHADIFIYDREAHTTELISVGYAGASAAGASAAGEPANGSSGEPSISADGRWVVFSSSASNLTLGDTNDLPDIFLHDRQTGRTVLVSMSVNGRSGNGMSAEPSISADGRWVVFESSADDLMPETDEHTGADIADTNATSDIFVYDRLGGSTRRVSLSSDGEQSNRASVSPDISADGRWVVFWSLADNLVPGTERGIYLHDRSTGTTQWVADGSAPSISPDGRWIGFLPARAASDQAADGATYAALYERGTGKTIVIGGYARRGIEGKPSRAIRFSIDGEWLALNSVFNPPDSLLASENSEWGQQVFLQDRKTGNWTLLSGTPDGLPGNSISASPSLSAEGRWIAFQSLADNLVSADTNGYMDVLVYDRETGAIELVSWASGQ